MLSLFLSKVPVNEPLQILQQGPMETAACLQGLFVYISLKFLIKIPLNIFIPSLKGPKKGASLHVPQKRGPYGNRCPFPEPYLAYLSGSPVKEPPL